MVYCSHHECGKGWTLPAAQINTTFLKLKSSESFVVEKLKCLNYYLETRVDLRSSYKQIQQQ